MIIHGTYLGNNKLQLKDNSIRLISFYGITNDTQYKNRKVFIDLDNKGIVREIVIAG